MFQASREFLQPFDHLYCRRLCFIALLAFHFLFGLRSEIANADSSKLTPGNLSRLLGAQVKTPNGDLLIRQVLGNNGSPYKQILIGQKFSEIQLDTDLDGAVDIWEVQSGAVTVMASEPHRRHFTRLNIVDRSEAGKIIRSDFRLSRDLKNYELSRAKVEKGGAAGTRFKTDTRDFLVADSESDGGENFEPATGVSIPAKEIPTTDALPFQSGGLSPVANGSGVEPTSQDLERAAIEFQSRIFEDDSTCQNLATNPIAKAQRDWWSILKSQGALSRDELAQKVIGSQFFDMSAKGCGDPKQRKSLELMAKGVADVMLSSSKGTSGSGSSSRFLRCLEDVGMGLTAARMERNFLRGFDQGESKVRCNWDAREAAPDSSGKVPPGGRPEKAFYDVVNDQVEVKMTSKHSGLTTYPCGVPVNYTNLMFHEMLHAAGVPSDTAKGSMVHEIVGCCGDPSSSRAQSCDRVKNAVKDEADRNRMEVRLGQNRDQINPFIWSLEDRFGTQGATDLLHKYYSGLGKIDGSDQCRSLDDPDKKLTCLLDERAKIQSFTSQFFTKECKAVVAGADRKKCKAFANEQATDMANAIASGLSGYRLKAQCEPARASANWYPIPWLQLFFVSSAQAETSCFEDLMTTNNGSSTYSPNDSEGSFTPIDSPGEKSRTLIAPSPNVADQIASGGQSTGTSPRVENGAGRKNPTSEVSPIPISRVDQQKDPVRYVEDRYRRATDFVGKASEGLSAIRRSLLPEAQAGERKTNAKDTEFSVFRPTQLKSTKVSIRSPFEGLRGIASIESGSKDKAQGNINEGTLRSATPVSNVATVDPSKLRKSPGSKLDSARNDGELEPANRRPSMGGVASSIKPPAAALGSRKPSNQAEEDAFAALFVLPYEKIAERIQRREIIEKLIQRRISIQLENSRIVGASQPIHRCIYQGLQKPLSCTPPVEMGRGK